MNIKTLNPETTKSRNRRTMVNRMKNGAANACALVHRAVKLGNLPSLKLNIVKCSDCIERATTYDHRDYNKPLDVNPVCSRCNNKRGPGIPRKWNKSNSRHSSHRLNYQKATKIREMYRSNKYTMMKLGEIFNVKESTIFFVIHNRTWRTE